MCRLKGKSNCLLASIAKDSFPPDLRVTHSTAKDTYFCRTKKAEVLVAHSTSSAFFKIQV